MSGFKKPSTTVTNEGGNVDQNSFKDQMEARYRERLSMGFVMEEPTNMDAESSREASLSFPNLEMKGSTPEDLTSSTVAPSFNVQATTHTPASSTTTTTRAITQARPPPSPASDNVRVILSNHDTRSTRPAMKNLITKFERRISNITSDSSKEDIVDTEEKNESRIAREAWHTVGGDSRIQLDIDPTAVTSSSSDETSSKSSDSPCPKRKLAKPSLANISLTSAEDTKTSSPPYTRDSSFAEDNQTMQPFILPRTEDSDENLMKIKEIKEDLKMVKKTIEESRKTYNKTDELRKIKENRHMINPDSLQSDDARGDSPEFKGKKDASGKTLITQKPLHTNLRPLVKQAKKQVDSKPEPKYTVHKKEWGSEMNAMLRREASSPGRIQPTATRTNEMNAPFLRTDRSASPGENVKHARPPSLTSSNPVSPSNTQHRLEQRSLRGQRKAGKSAKDETKGGKTSAMERYKKFLENSASAHSASVLGGSVKPTKQDTSQPSSRSLPRNAVSQLSDRSSDQSLSKDRESRPTTRKPQMSNGSSREVSTKSSMPTDVHHLQQTGKVAENVTSLPNDVILQNAQMEPPPRKDQEIVLSSKDEKFPVEEAETDKESFKRLSSISPQKSSFRNVKPLKKRNVIGKPTNAVTANRFKPLIPNKKDTTVQRNVDKKEKLSELDPLLTKDQLADNDLVPQHIQSPFSSSSEESSPLMSFEDKVMKIKAKRLLKMFQGPAGKGQQPPKIDVDMKETTSESKPTVSSERVPNSSMKDKMGKLDHAVATLETAKAKGVPKAGPPLSSTEEAKTTRGSKPWNWKPGVKKDMTPTQISTGPMHGDGNGKIEQKVVAASIEDTVLPVQGETPDAESVYSPSWPSFDLKKNLQTSPENLSPPLEEIPEPPAKSLPHFGSVHEHDGSEDISKESPTNKSPDRKKRRVEKGKKRRTRRTKAGTDNQEISSSPEKKNRDESKTKLKGQRSNEKSKAQTKTELAQEKRAGSPKKETSKVNDKVGDKVKDVQVDDKAGSPDVVKGQKKSMRRSMTMYDARSRWGGHDKTNRVDDVIGTEDLKAGQGSKHSQNRSPVRQKQSLSPDASPMSAQWQQSPKISEKNAASGDDMEESPVKSHIPLAVVEGETPRRHRANVLAKYRRWREEFQETAKPCKLPMTPTFRTALDKSETEEKAMHNWAPLFAETPSGRALLCAGDSLSECRVGPLRGVQEQTTGGNRCHEGYIGCTRAPNRTQKREEEPLEMDFVSQEILLITTEGKPMDSIMKRGVKGKHATVQRDESECGIHPGVVISETALSFCIANLFMPDFIYTFQGIGQICSEIILTYSYLLNFELLIGALCMSQYGKQLKVSLGAVYETIQKSVTAWHSWFIHTVWNDSCSSTVQNTLYQSCVSNKSVSLNQNNNAGKSTRSRLTYNSHLRLVRRCGHTKASGRLRREATMLPRERMQHFMTKMQAMFTQEDAYPDNPNQCQFDSVMIEVLETIDLSYNCLLMQGCRNEIARLGFSCFQVKSQQKSDLESDESSRPLTDNQDATFTLSNSGHEEENNNNKRWDSVAGTSNIKQTSDTSCNVPENSVRSEVSLPIQSNLKTVTKLTQTKKGSGSQHPLPWKSGLGSIHDLENSNYNLHKPHFCESTDLAARKKQRLERYKPWEDAPPETSLAFSSQHRIDGQKVGNLTSRGMQKNNVYDNGGVHGNRMVAKTFDSPYHVMSKSSQVSPIKSKVKRHLCVETLRKTSHAKESTHQPSYRERLKMLQSVQLDVDYPEILGTSRIPIPERIVDSAYRRQLRILKQKRWLEQARRGHSFEEGPFHSALTRTVYTSVKANSPLKMISGKKSKKGSQKTAAHLYDKRKTEKVRKPSTPSYVPDNHLRLDSDRTNDFAHPSPGAHRAKEGATHKKAPMHSLSFQRKVKALVKSYVDYLNTTSMSQFMFDKCSCNPYLSMESESITEEPSCGHTTCQTHQCPDRQLGNGCAATLVSMVPPTPINLHGADISNSKQTPPKSSLAESCQFGMNGSTVNSTSTIDKLSPEASSQLTMERELGRKISKQRQEDVQKDSTNRPDKGTTQYSSTTTEIYIPQPYVPRVESTTRITGVEETDAFSNSGITELSKLQEESNENSENHGSEKKHLAHENTLQIDNRPRNTEGVLNCQRHITLEVQNNELEHHDKNGNEYGNTLPAYSARRYLLGQEHNDTVKAPVENTTKAANVKTGNNIKNMSTLPDAEPVTSEKNQSVVSAYRSLALADHNQLPNTSLGLTPKHHSGRKLWITPTYPPGLERQSVRMLKTAAVKRHSPHRRLPLELPRPTHKLAKLSNIDKVNEHQRQEWKKRSQNTDVLCSPKELTSSSTSSWHSVACDPFTTYSFVSDSNKAWLSKGNSQRLKELKIDQFDCSKNTCDSSIAFGKGFTEDNVQDFSWIESSMSTLKSIPELPYNATESCLNQQDGHTIRSRHVRHDASSSRGDRVVGSGKFKGNAMRTYAHTLKSENETNGSHSVTQVQTVDSSLPGIRSMLSSYIPRSYSKSSRKMHGNHTMRSASEHLITSISLARSTGGKFKINHQQPGNISFNKPPRKPRLIPCLKRIRYSPKSAVSELPTSLFPFKEINLSPAKFHNKHDVFKMMEETHSTQQTIQPKQDPKSVGDVYEDEKVSPRSHPFFGSVLKFWENRGSIFKGFHGDHFNPFTLAQNPQGHANTQLVQDDDDSEGNDTTFHSLEKINETNLSIQNMSQDLGALTGQSGLEQLHYAKSVFSPKLQIPHTEVFLPEKSSVKSPTVAFEFCVDGESAKHPVEENCSLMYECKKQNKDQRQRHLQGKSSKIPRLKREKSSRVETTHKNMDTIPNFHRDMSLNMNESKYQQIISFLNSINVGHELSPEHDDVEITIDSPKEDITGKGRLVSRYKIYHSLVDKAADLNGTASENSDRNGEVNKRPSVTEMKDDFVSSEILETNWQTKPRFCPAKHRRSKRHTSFNVENKKLRDAHQNQKSSVSNKLKVGTSPSEVTGITKTGTLPVNLLIFHPSPVVSESVNKVLMSGGSKSVKNDTSEFQTKSQKRREKKSNSKHSPRSQREDYTNLTLLHVPHKTTRAPVKAKIALPMKTPTDTSSAENTKSSNIQLGGSQSFDNQSVSTSCCSLAGSTCFLISTGLDHTSESSARSTPQGQRSEINHFIDSTPTSMTISIKDKGTYKINKVPKFLQLVSENRNNDVQPPRNLLIPHEFTSAKNGQRKHYRASTHAKDIYGPSGSHVKKSKAGYHNPVYSDSDPTIRNKLKNRSPNIENGSFQEDSFDVTTNDKANRKASPTVGLSTQQCYPHADKTPTVDNGNQLSTFVDSPSHLKTNAHESSYQMSKESLQPCENCRDQKCIRFAPTDDHITNIPILPSTPKVDTISQTSGTQVDGQSTEVQTELQGLHLQLHLSPPTTNKMTMTQMALEKSSRDTESSSDFKKGFDLSRSQKRKNPPRVAKKMKREGVTCYMVTKDNSAEKTITPDGNVLTGDGDSSQIYGQEGQSSTPKLHGSVKTTQTSNTTPIESNLNSFSDIDLDDIRRRKKRIMEKTRLATQSPKAKKRVPSTHKRSSNVVLSKRGVIVDDFLPDKPSPNAIILHTSPHQKRSAVQSYSLNKQFGFKHMEQTKQFSRSRRDRERALTVPIGKILSQNMFQLKRRCRRCKSQSPRTHRYRSFHRTQNATTKSSSSCTALSRDNKHSAHNQTLSSDGNQTKTYCDGCSAYSDNIRLSEEQLGNSGIKRSDDHYAQNVGSASMQSNIVTSEKDSLKSHNTRVISSNVVASCEQQSSESKCKSVSHSETKKNPYCCSTGDTIKKTKAAGGNSSSISLSDYLKTHGSDRKEENCSAQKQTDCIEDNEKPLCNASMDNADSKTHNQKETAFLTCLRQGSGDQAAISKNDKPVKAHCKESRCHNFAEYQSCVEEIKKNVSQPLSSTTMISSSNIFREMLLASLPKVVELKSKHSNLKHNLNKLLMKHLSNGDNDNDVRAYVEYVTKKTMHSCSKVMKKLTNRSYLRMTTNHSRVRGDGGPFSGSSSTWSFSTLLKKSDICASTSASFNLDTSAATCKHCISGDTCSCHIYTSSHSLKRSASADHQESVFPNNIVFRKEHSSQGTLIVPELTVLDKSSEETSEWTGQSRDVEIFLGEDVPVQEFLGCFMNGIGQQTNNSRLPSNNSLATKSSLDSQVKVLIDKIFGGETDPNDTINPGYKIDEHDVKTHTNPPRTTNTRTKKSSNYSNFNELNRLPKKSFSETSTATLCPTHSDSNEGYLEMRNRNEKPCYQRYNDHKKFTQFKQKKNGPIKEMANLQPNKCINSLDLACLSGSKTSEHTSWSVDLGIRKIHTELLKISKPINSTISRIQRKDNRIKISTKPDENFRHKSQLGKSRSDDLFSPYNHGIVESSPLFQECDHSLNHNKTNKNKVRVKKKRSETSYWSAGASDQPSSQTSPSIQRRDRDVVASGNNQKSVSSLNKGKKQSQTDPSTSYPDTDFLSEVSSQETCIAMPHMHLKDTSPRSKVVRSRVQNDDYSDLQDLAVNKNHRSRSRNSVNEGKSTDSPVQLTSLHVEKLCHLFEQRKVNRRVSKSHRKLSQRHLISLLEKLVLVDTMEMEGQNKVANPQLETPPLSPDHAQMLHQSTEQQASGIKKQEEKKDPLSEDDSMTLTSKQCTTIEQQGEHSNECLPTGFQDASEKTENTTPHTKPTEAEYSDQLKSVKDVSIKDLNKCGTKLDNGRKAHSSQEPHDDAKCVKLLFPEENEQGPYAVIIEPRHLNSALSPKVTTQDGLIRIEFDMDNESGNEARQIGQGITEEASSTPNEHSDDSAVIEGEDMYSRSEDEDTLYKDKRRMRLKHPRRMSGVTKGTNTEDLENSNSESEINHHSVTISHSTQTPLNLNKVYHKKGTVKTPSRHSNGSNDSFVTSDSSDNEELTEEIQGARSKPRKRETSFKHKNVESKPKQISSRSKMNKKEPMSRKNIRVYNVKPTLALRRKKSSLKSDGSGSKHSSFTGESLNDDRSSIGEVASSDEEMDSSMVSYHEKKEKPGIERIKRKLSQLRPASHVPENQDEKHGRTRKGELSGERMSTQELNKMTASYNENILMENSEAYPDKTDANRQLFSRSSLLDAHRMPDVGVHKGRKITKHPHMLGDMEVKNFQSQQNEPPDDTVGPYREDVNTPTHLKDYLNQLSFTEELCPPASKVQNLRSHLFSPRSSAIKSPVQHQPQDKPLVNKDKLWGHSNTGGHQYNDLQRRSNYVSAMPYNYPYNDRMGSHFHTPGSAVQRNLELYSGRSKRYRWGVPGSTGQFDHIHATSPINSLAFASTAANFTGNLYRHSHKSSPTHSIMNFSNDGYNLSKRMSGQMLNQYGDYHANKEGAPVTPKKSRVRFSDDVVFNDSLPPTGNVYMTPHTNSVNSVNHNAWSENIETNPNPNLGTAPIKWSFDSQNRQIPAMEYSGRSPEAMSTSPKQSNKGSPAVASDKEPGSPGSTTASDWDNVVKKRLKMKISQLPKHRSNMKRD